MRRPRRFLLAGGAVLALAAAPAAWLELTPTSFAGLPRGPEAMRGYHELVARAGPGAVTPLRERARTALIQPWTRASSAAFEAVA